MSLNNSEDDKDLLLVQLHKTEGNKAEYQEDSDEFFLDEREASESWEDNFLSDGEVGITISLLLVS